MLWAKRLNITQLVQSTLPVGRLRIKTVDMAKHVVPTAEYWRTGVQIPPAPPTTQAFIREGLFFEYKMDNKARYLREAIWELGDGKPLHELMACANDIHALREDHALPPFCRQDIVMSQVACWFSENCSDREQDLVVISSRFLAAWTTLHIDCGTLGQAPSDYAREEVLKVFQAASRLGIQDQLLLNLSKKGHSFFNFED